MRSLRSTLALAAAIALAPVALTVTATSASAAENATVTVVHGIPGVNVDVYVNDKLTLPNFKPGTVTDPLSLPDGMYTIDIKAAGSPASSADVIGPLETGFSGGRNYTVAAHLGNDGKPTANIYDNDISAVADGKGRVTVVHMAQAPTVAITANGATLIPSLSNPDKAGADVPAATYKVGVVAGGKTVFSTDLPVEAGMNTIVYAYGTYPKTFAVAVQKISLTGMPSGVPAGEAGLAKDSSPLPYGLIAVAVLAAGAVVLASVRLTSTSRQS